MEWLSETYNTFNAELFEGKLPKVAFEMNVARKAIFHYSPPSKIEIGADMAKATAATVADDLLHAMVHIKNHKEGVPDHTSNQYHNQHFSSAALSIGLYVCVLKNRGWALTVSREADARRCERVLAPAEKTNQRLRGVIETAAIPTGKLNALRRSVAQRLAAKPKRHFALKYVCLCKPPFNNVRSGRRPDGDHPLDITCNICNAKFVLAEDQSQSGQKPEN